MLGDNIGAITDYDQAVALGVDSLLEPDPRRIFYEVKESTARAAERERLQSEHSYLLEVADQEIEEHERRYENMASEREQLAGENYQLRAQIEQLSHALDRKVQISAASPGLFG